ncbi:MAG: hypothetical protein AB7Y46_03430 [Armatimonadota bacterium]
MARRTRSRRPRTRRLLAHAGIGALLALVLAGLGWAMVSGLARAAAGERALPASVGERVALAATAVANALSALAATLGRYGGAILAVLGIAACGALAGALVYLLRLRGWLNLAPPSARTSRRRRRNAWDGS